MGVEPVRCFIHRAIYQCSGGHFRGRAGDPTVQVLTMRKPMPESAGRKSDATEPMSAVLSNEERYRALFDLVPVAVYSIDTSGVIQEFNARAAELWGCEPVLGDTDKRFCGSFKLFRPDGSFMPHEQCPMAEVVTGTLAEAQDAEVVIERRARHRRRLR
jgi:PAS domain-containing protein